MKLFILLLCINLSSCVFSNNLVKNDIDAKIVYYNLNCNLINSNEMNCKIEYDLDHMHGNDQGLSLNEPKLIMLLYNIFYHLSLHGKELGFKYGKLTKWETRLNFLKNNPKNTFTMQYFNDVDPESIQGYSYHLKINKPYILQDAIEVFRQIDNNYKNIKNTIRNPVIDEKVNLVFNYKIQSFIRQSSYYNHRYTYVSNKIFNHCNKETIDTKKGEHFVSIIITINGKISKFNYMDEIEPPQITTSSRVIKLQTFPSEITTSFNEEWERLTLKEIIHYENNFIQIESIFSKKHADCYSEIIDDFIDALLNPKK